MQRWSVGRVIGINKKPIPMSDNVIETINKQAKEEREGIEFSDINLKTTVEDYQEGVRILMMTLNMMTSRMKPAMIPLSKVTIAWVMNMMTRLMNMMMTTMIQSKVKRVSSITSITKPTMNLTSGKKEWGEVNKMIHLPCTPISRERK